MKEITPEFLKKNAFLAAKWLDGQLIAVFKLTYDRARLVVGFNELTYERSY